MDLKYTILGFNQEKACEVGLELDDLLLIRYFVDFRENEKMISKEIEGKRYYWINYEGILQELPILKIKKDRIYRKLKRLCDLGILEHKTVKQAGTYSFYTVGHKYFQLISSTDLSVKKPSGSVKKPEGYGENTVPKDPSIKDPSTNNPNILSKDNICTISEKWNKLGLQQIKSINSNTNRFKLLKARMNEYGLVNILKAIDNINQSDFLKGQNNRNWMITFDWLIKPNNFLKVLEGNYSNKKQGRNNNAISSGNNEPRKGPSEESLRLEKLAREKGLLPNGGMDDFDCPY